MKPVKVQRAFRLYINVGRRGDAPNRKTIMRLVNSFQTTGIVNKFIVWICIHLYIYSGCSYDIRSEHNICYTT